jgi:hypothetical protein
MPEKPAIFGAAKLGQPDGELKPHRTAGFWVLLADAGSNVGERNGLA